MARFKPGTSGVRSDDSANWATTTAQVVTDVAFYPIAVSECFYQISDRLPFETKSFSQTTFLRFSFFDRGGRNNEYTNFTEVKWSVSLSDHEADVMSNFYRSIPTPCCNKNSDRMFQEHDYFCQSEYISLAKICLWHLLISYKCNSRVITLLGNKAFWLDYASHMTNQSALYKPR